MYISVAEILETDMEVVKKFVIENADEIVDYQYDEYNIEQMNLDSLINVGRRILSGNDGAIFSAAKPSGRRALSGTT